MRFRFSFFDKVGLFFFAAFIIGTSLIYVFEERFDEDNWKKQPTKRYRMVDDIFEKNILLGKSKDEIIDLLGEPDSKKSDGKEIFLYRLGNPPSFFNSERELLLIVFTDQKVQKVAIALE